MIHRSSSKTNFQSEIESNSNRPSPTVPPTIYTSNSSPILPIMLYSLSSSSLLLLNKLLLSSLPLPSTLLTIQLVFTVVSLYILNSLSLLDIDKLQPSILKIYSVYTILFTSGIVCSLQCLRETSVESVVMVKSVSPIGVCVLERILEWIEWGEESSNIKRSIAKRQIMGLLMVGLGGCIYGWKGGLGKWCLGYWSCLGIEMVLGRRIIRGIPFQTHSGPVQYTNLLALIPSIFFSITSGEISTLFTLSSSHPTLISFLFSFRWNFYLYLLLSLLMGGSIGYTSWWTRSQVSATSYTLIGVLSKIGSIIGSSLVWGGRSIEELGGLVLSIGGGMMYVMGRTKDLEKQRECEKNKTFIEINNK